MPSSTRRSSSSSSGLLMSRVQIDCRHPERCVIGHPFNPPHLVPLVEVVGGEKTGPEAIERALAFYAAIGKQPIHIRREVPGRHRQLVGSGYSDAGEWQWALGFIANPYYRFRPRPEIFGSSKLYALRQ